MHNGLDVDSDLLDLKLSCKSCQKNVPGLNLTVIPAPDAHGCANAANTRMCKNSASRNLVVLTY